MFGVARRLMTVGAASGVGSAQEPGPGHATYRGCVYGSSSDLFAANKVAEALGRGSCAEIANEFDARHGLLGGAGARRDALPHRPSCRGFSR
jgi:hypothetical protein